MSTASINQLATKLAFRNLQSQPWHQLQRLELSYGLSDCQIAQILNVCGPLRVVSVMQASFWYRSLAALERHAQTLEGLRVYDGDMSSWMGQWILVTFPKLTHLKLGRVFAHEIVTGRGAEEARKHRVAEDIEDDIFYRQQEVEQDEDEMVDELNEIMVRFAASRDLQRVKPWVCLNLIQLTLFISFPTVASSQWDEQVFQQISKLDRLESLNLGQSVHIRDHSLHGGFYTRGLDLRIQSGLTLLAPLKNLVTLKFSGTQQELDEQDLMWIMDQWSTLKEMSRDLHYKKGKREALLRLVEARSIEPLVQAFEFEDENGEGEEELRSLKWVAPEDDEDRTPNRLAFKSLQCRPWQQLQQLYLSDNLSDSQVAQILDACGPLRIVTVKEASFWYRSLAALEKHSQTLEELRVFHGDLRSWMCQWIMASFPKLTCLKLGSVFAHEMVVGDGAEKARADQLAQDARDDISYRELEIRSGDDEMVDELNEIMARFAASRDLQRVKPWVCLNLVRLTMFIAFPSGQEATDWDKQVFQQISKLRHLEHLNFGQSVFFCEDRIHSGIRVRSLQLKIQFGLTLLAPIRNMVTLKFVGASARQQLDEQDLRWILDQWPNLKELNHGLHNDLHVRFELEKLIEERGVRLRRENYVYGYESD
ncbi:hypothetical protein EMPS_02034 [Entomortierella parvispora]|uniref:F-box domain-containing protein n=1 Tax=Entomortierella parvispora TaxID=205924 RepID=A0A9P3LT40_9FUNG|nr:hypothetical protein EMPS_02034 [Entomortierella parvispora]